MACESASSGERYRTALDPDVSLSEALSSCRALGAPSAIGDCATAAVEVRGSITEDACEGVPVGLWEEECRFMLAERQRAAGRLDQSLETCREIRFGRECTFHLIRAEAWEVLDVSALEASSRLVPLQDLPFARDAEKLFWREWHHRGQVKGRSADPERCQGLVSPEACRAAVGELFRDAAAALGWDKVCDRTAAGQAPLTRAGGEPAFAASAEVEGWVARSCSKR